jgi:hypothetical protein
MFTNWYNEEQRGDTTGSRGDTSETRGAPRSQGSNNLPSKTVIHIDRQTNDDSDEDNYSTTDTRLGRNEQAIADEMPEDAYWQDGPEEFSVMNITVTRTIEELGDEARESISKNYDSYGKKRAWTPVNVKRLKSDQRRRVIRSSIFLKQNFDAEGNHDKLKSRLVADGHMQDKSLY